MKNSRPEASRDETIGPGSLHAILAALGLLPRGDLLPALSGWRGRRRTRSA
ncbi:MAG TPA: hypothetical protein VHG51_04745 [Longimicrobiaceae bacterium]|nr:hypothetical protein [Longimicrobiaceae bacterium]